MNDKTSIAGELARWRGASSTETLATALGILAQEASHRRDPDDLFGDADTLAKASLRLHDQAEEIERLKAEIAALKDAAHYAKGTAELAIRHRDEAEVLVAVARGALSEEISLAIQHSRNFATAKPDIGPTEREHILGLCMLLERTLLQSAEAPYAIP